MRLNAGRLLRDFLVLALACWVAIGTPVRPGADTPFHFHQPSDPVHVHAHAHGTEPAALQELDFLNDTPLEQTRAGDYLPAIAPLTVAISLAVDVWGVSGQGTAATGWLAGATSPPPRFLSVR